MLVLMLAFLHGGTTSIYLDKVEQKESNLEGVKSRLPLGVFFIFFMMTAWAGKQRAPAHSLRLMSSQYVLSYRNTRAQHRHPVMKRL